MKLRTKSYASIFISTLSKKIKPRPLNAMTFVSEVPLNVFGGYRNVFTAKLTNRGGALFSLF